MFRWFALGFVGACCIVLAMRPTYVVWVTHDAAASTQPLPVATIDVSPLARSTQLPDFLHLAPGEHIVAIDGQPCGEVEALAWLMVQDDPSAAAMTCNEVLKIFVGKAASGDSGPSDRDRPDPRSLRATPRDKRSFIDLTVDGPAGTRRVLVLLH
jgi:hypothetical protein